MGIFVAQTYEDPTIYTTAEMLRDYAMLTGANNAEQTQPLATQERVSELEAEVQRLRMLLSKAKGVNDAMWEAVVHRIAADKGDATEVAME